MCVTAASCSRFVFGVVRDNEANAFKADQLVGAKSSEKNRLWLIKRHLLKTVDIEPKKKDRQQ